MSYHTRFALSDQTQATAEKEGEQDPRQARDKEQQLVAGKRETKKNNLLCGERQRRTSCCVCVCQVVATQQVLQHMSES